MWVNMMEQQRRRKITGRRGLTSYHHHQNDSPPRPASPNSLMMSLSTVPATFSTSSSSPESSPRSTSSRGSFAGRPPVVSPQSPPKEHEHQEANLAPRPVRMIMAELETMLPSASALPPSQQPHHPSYALRRVRSLPTSSACNRVPPGSTKVTKSKSEVEESDTTIVSPPSVVMRLVNALQSNDARPVGLNLEEKALWDAIQASKRQARQEGLSQATEHILKSSHSPDVTWESKFVQIQEQAKLQQRDNSRSLQAIQRILADVQAQRDEAMHQLHDMQTQPSGAESCTSMSSSDPEREIMQRDLQVMSARIMDLEKELRSTPPPFPSPAAEPIVSTEYICEQDEEPEPSTGVEDPVLPSLEVEHLELEKRELQSEIEWKDRHIQSLQEEISESKNFACFEELRKELHEKSSALENAKMIIGSLENASGSLATDLRAKLKRRDEEIAMLQNEVTENKRTSDKLANELKNLQKSKAAAQPQLVVKRSIEAEQVKRLQLSSRLETNMAEIFAASVVLESTQDPGAVSQLSELLTDSCNALKEGIDVIENGHSAEDEHLPARLWKELVEKRKTVIRLEERLERQQVELNRLRSKTEETEQKRENEVHSLQAEIKILKQQCDTNMEVLTRKERELTVLRDSLMVGDDDVGYISDDEEDDDETGSDSKQAMMAPTSPVPTDYGPTQVEALARLRAHGGNLSFDSGAHEKDRQCRETIEMELSKARADYDKAKRELKIQKESLSNAKMIISSLERANKSMMEDLRARLQDSNTAIASLLEKSLESERTCAALRSELESLKKSEESHKAEDEDETALALTLSSTSQQLFLTETID